MNLMRYHALALAVFKDEIDTFDHIREMVELRDTSRWLVNLDYTCFYCIRTSTGGRPAGIITRSEK